MNVERRLIMKALGSGVALAFLGPLASIAYAEKKELTPKTLVCPIHYWHEVSDSNGFESYVAGLITEVMTGILWI